VTEGQNNQKPGLFTGVRFDKPLYVYGEVSEEPERYLAEKPYELSKFEFSILRKGKFKSNTLSHLVSGATVGLVIIVIGQAIDTLADKKTPSLERWELWSILAGIVITVFLYIVNRKWKSPEEKEYEEILDDIDQHFKETPRRRIHLSGRK